MKSPMIKHKTTYDASEIKHLKSTWCKIDERNKKLGLYRYDYADLDSHPFLSYIHISIFRQLARRIMRAMDLFAPITFHRIIRMPKTIVPTVFYHIGQAYLVRESLDNCNWPADATDSVCEDAISEAIPSGFLSWRHPYKAHASVYANSFGKQLPPSCAHHTARLGILLLDVGKAHQRDDFIKKGESSANALLEYHNWAEYPDGTCTVSYYPTTNDETINTCTDIAAQLAAVPNASSNHMLKTRVKGIVRMAITEQLPTGAWLYCTKRHIEKEGNGDRCDCFHHAQVIQSLARIVQSDIVEEEHSDLYIAIGRGMEYLLDSFFDKSWIAYYFPGKKGLLAPVVAYSETLAAIYWIKKAGIPLTTSIKIRIRASIIPLISAALRFLDPHTGDVASAVHFGFKYNIQSIRWGSGPLLEALSYALWLLEVEEGRIGNGVDL